MNTRTVEDLRCSAPAILQEIEQSRVPLLIIREGLPGIVMLPQEMYEEQQHRLHLARLLFEAEEDVRAGRTQPLAEAMKELHNGKRAAG